MYPLNAVALSFMCQLGKVAFKVLKPFQYTSMKTFTNLLDFTGCRWCFQAQIFLGLKDFESRVSHHKRVFLNCL
jgi:hypothetical protein